MSSLVALCHHLKENGIIGYTYFLRPPVLFPYILAVFKPCQNLLDGGFLFLQLFHLQALAAPSSLLVQILQRFLNKFDVFDTKLITDDVEITDRVYITFDMNDLCIVKAADHLKDGIDGTDMRQKCITKASSGRCSSGQACNIIDCEIGWNLGLWFVMLAQPIIS